MGNYFDFGLIALYSESMQDEIATTVIANVARIIHEQNIQRQELAEKMGIKPSSLTKMLSRDKPIRTDSIVKLSKALEVDPCDLMCNHQAAKPATPGPKRKK